ncbi:MAG: hypothetical protein HYS33_07265 [Acidobacteria bacterium]|nr:hypothetical protein [Acidobacteriota bacterium]
MNWRNGAILLVGTLLTLCLSRQALLAQVCQGEEAMVEDYKKGLSEMVEKVKGESLEEFQRAYHQKSCMSKLNLGASFVNIAIECLDKAGQAPATTKEQAKDIAAKREKHDALKTKVEQYRKELKAAESARDAKDLIAKFEIPK